MYDHIDSRGLRLRLNGTLEKHRGLAGASRESLQQYRVRAFIRTWVVNSYNRVNPMVVVNDNSKYWMKKIDISNNWWTWPKIIIVKKLCSTQRHIRPVIKRKWRVENIFAFLQLDKLVNLSNYKTIIFFSKWFFASLERKLNNHLRLLITGAFKGNRKEFEFLISGVWSK